MTYREAFDDAQAHHATVDEDMAYFLQSEWCAGCRAYIHPGEDHPCWDHDEECADEEAARADRMAHDDEGSFSE